MQPFPYYAGRERCEGVSFAWHPPVRGLPGGQSHTQDTLVSDLGGLKLDIPIIRIKYNGFRVGLARCYLFENFNTPKLLSCGNCNLSVNSTKLR